MTCAKVQPVANDPDHHRETAHRLPARMATATIIEVVTTADLMQQAIYEGHPQERIEHLREVARAQLEAYLDLMAQSAVQVRALNP